MKRAWRNAAVRGDANTLLAMLGKGDENVNSRDRHGQTALMIAARNGHIEAARVLINSHADLDHAAKYGLSALMVAIINGHEEIAQLLIEAGADIGITGTGAPGFAGRSALELACERGAVAIVKRLICRRS
ncbi:MAG: ankyrin repeat domain-containing protein [Gammaproteobacteria bacterium]